MGYQCVDCSYKGKKFVGGACPACGSNNVRRETSDAKQEKPKVKPYRLVFAVALWLFFIVEVYKKLS